MFYARWCVAACWVCSLGVSSSSSAGQRSVADTAAAAAAAAEAHVGTRRGRRGAAAARRRRCPHTPVPALAALARLSLVSALVFPGPLWITRFVYLFGFSKRASVVWANWRFGCLVTVIEFISWRLVLVLCILCERSLELINF